jgi:dimethylargininase
MLTALTRQVSPALGSCQLEFLPRVQIDPIRAAAQHCSYLGCLAELGAYVITLPADPKLPDCVFVEDPALVLDEVAVISRMGAESRRAEAETLATEIAKYRKVLRLEAPATLEGGDVMRIGKTLYVGRSRRTNVAGIEQLAKLLDPYGYYVVPIEVRDCLHLKSACCFIGDNTILANRAWMDQDALCGLKILDVPSEEPCGANTLRIGGTVVMPSAFPRTRELIERTGFLVRTLDYSELLKAEAGVTCMSLLFDA